MNIKEEDIFVFKQDQIMMEMNLDFQMVNTIKMVIMYGLKFLLLFG